MVTVQVRELVLITRGHCVVVKGCAVLNTLGPGALIGEGTFARGEARRAIDPRPERLHRAVPLASATVSASDGAVEYIAWPILRLSRHVSKSAHVKACVMTIVAAAQADKLEHATAQY